MQPVARFHSPHVNRLPVDTENCTVIPTGQKPTNCRTDETGTACYNNSHRELFVCKLRVIQCTALQSFMENLRTVLAVQSVNLMARSNAFMPLFMPGVAATSEHSGTPRNKKAGCKGIRLDGV